ncbi:MAG: hypothetical protein WC503_02940 [Candidatus Shapirobacteria bacterium]
MSQISVTGDEFPNILCAFLLDLLNHGSSLQNENFDVILRKLKNAGIRSNLLQMYIDMPGNDRVLYKFVRPILMGITKGTARITITNGGTEDEI